MPTRGEERSAWGAEREQWPSLLLVQVCAPRRLLTNTACTICLQSQRAHAHHSPLAHNRRHVAPLRNSNGCTIGCKRCDGTNNHLGHGVQRFVYSGPKPMPAWTPEPGTMTMDPKTTQCAVSHKDKATNKTVCDVPFGPRSMCGELATTKATICDPALRTVNTQAECGTADDIYYYSPWRAPGSAPTIDACGSAGGRFPGQGRGGAGAQFANSSVAKEGDVGSRLPKGPPEAIWRIGQNYEVGWTVQAHHGGGYVSGRPNLCFSSAPARCAQPWECYSNP